MEQVPFRYLGNKVLRHFISKFPAKGKASTRLQKETREQPGVARSKKHLYARYSASKAGGMTWWRMVIGNREVQEKGIENQVLDAPANEKPEPSLLGTAGRGDQSLDQSSTTPDQPFRSLWSCAEGSNQNNGRLFGLHPPCATLIDSSIFQHICSQLPALLYALSCSSKGSTILAMHTGMSPEQQQVIVNVLKE